MFSEGCKKRVKGDKEERGNLTISCFPSAGGGGGMEEGGEAEEEESISQEGCSLFFQPIPSISRRREEKGER